MTHQTGKFGSGLRLGDVLFVGLWVLVLIVALLLQGLPILLVVMMLSLVFGLSKWAVLTVVPIAFTVIVYLSCLIAAKLTRRRAAAVGTAGSGARVSTGWRYALPANTVSPADYYRDVKRQG